jgi:cyclic di-GMP phosphodiesterase
MKPMKTQLPDQTTAGSDKTTSQPLLMVVDDQPLNIKVVRKYLELEGYSNSIGVSDPAQVLATVDREKPDLLFLDIMMPQISGLVLLEQLRANETTRFLPVIILTAMDDQETKRRALELGATDFLSKPIEPTEMVPRLRNALLIKDNLDRVQSESQRLEEMVERRTAELVASRLEVIYCLGRASEYRDNETGRHVIRVGRFVGIVARAIGLDEETATLFEQAAPLHDVGKIGVSDSILLKPGKLTPEEFEVMQRHCNFGKRTFETMSPDQFKLFKSHTSVGADVLGNCHSPILQIASNIALTHHERWDGTGYPLGLAGEDIPLEGRITAIADVFDALSSRRPYKSAWPLDKCFDMMAAERGKHFDPRLLDAFFEHRDEVVKTQIDLADID